ncbi:MULTISPECIES: LysR substrate-binding domain-containing protein [Ramlibacter]|uniref:LysR family transcriptional regulator n=1 Tax=Ramlibacter pinisoli TaxID=2682844 RepID=A0A6N8IML6_9BURK|nr:MULTISPECIES: LysR substrate-binding domain-containing protein [Ramlibacter]MBA2963119.1 LysR family transcriptional regulator [Ramlibacter sp. CGMCC 1.13660]MVQ28089.1 LysR family transcriptional regulator [Ramlibacter pinisoli]
MIRELKTFVAVAREGTFAAAGDRIGLTQAAVSAQMKRLEQELGFELFDRSGRAARLNAMGTDLLAQAQDLLQAYGNLGARRPQAAAPAVVNVGAIASVQRSVLPGVLARFHRQLPGCRTRVVPGVSMQLVDLVDAGEIDLAVVIRPPFSVQSDLRWTTLAHEPFRLVVPRGVRGNDWAGLLATRPFIRYDRASYGGRQVDRFLRAAHIEVREVCELDELEAIVQLVAHGAGVALLPQTVAQRRWPSGVRAIDLGERTFHRDIGLVHRPVQGLGEAARRLADMVAAAYRRRP